MVETWADEAKSSHEQRLPAGNYKSLKTILNFFCGQSKDAGDSDSEKEQEELGEIENVLKKHDPTFLA